MQIKFSEDVAPLSDLKINPGKVVGRVNETHRPTLLTSRGRGVAVVQGLTDIREGNTVTLNEAKKILGVE